MAAGAVLAVAACGGGDDADSEVDGDAALTAASIPASLQPIVEAARGEGALRLSWGNFLGGAKGAPALIDGFEDYYGLDIDVTFTPGAGQGDMVAKVEQEGRAGLEATTDVLDMNPYSVIQTASRDVLLPTDWSAYPAVLDQMVVGDGGVAVDIQTWLLGIAYHTQRVQADEVPHTMAELLDEKYAGRVYSTPFAAGFEVLASDDAWGLDRTMDYLEPFSKQIGGLGFNIQPLLNGEYDLMALLVPPGEALAAEADGAPIGFVIPSDAAIEYKNLVGIPTNAAHPNAARLFINYLASPEGQAVLRTVDYADSPLIEGSLTASMIADAEAAGATFVVADLAFYQRQTDFDRVYDELVSQLISGGG